MLIVQISCGYKHCMALTNRKSTFDNFLETKATHILIYVSNLIELVIKKSIVSQYVCIQYMLCLTIF